MNSSLCVRDTHFQANAMLILYLVLSSLAFVFTAPLIIHPISLGINLLILRLFVAATTAVITTSWLGFIVFLIYIGGILVIFAYVAALTPNVIFSKAHILKSYFLFLIPLMTLSFFLPNDLVTYISNLSLPSQVFNDVGAPIYDSPNLFILLFLGLVLLLALIAVVKICHFNLGTLRPFA